MEKLRTKTMAISKQYSEHILNPILNLGALFVTRWRGMRSSTILKTNEILIKVSIVFNSSQPIRFVLYVNNTNLIGCRNSNNSI